MKNGFPKIERCNSATQRAIKAQQQRKRLKTGRGIVRRKCWMWWLRGRGGGRWRNSSGQPGQHRNSSSAMQQRQHQSRNSSRTRQGRGTARQRRAAARSASCREAASAHARSAQIKALARSALTLCCREAGARASMLPRSGSIWLCRCASNGKARLSDKP